MIDMLVRRAGLFTAFCCIVLLSAVFARPFSYNLSAAKELRFAPSDSSIVVFIPSIDDLLARLHVHVCPFISDLADACGFRPTGGAVDGPIFEKLEFDFDEFDEFDDFDDFDPIAAYAFLRILQSKGLDTSKPAMVAFRGPVKATDIIIVASYHDDRAGCEGLETLLAGDDPLDSDLVEDSFDLGLKDDPENLCALSDDVRSIAVEVGDNDTRPFFFKKMSDLRFVIFSNRDTFESVTNTPNPSAQFFMQDNFRQAFDAMVTGIEPAMWAYLRHPGVTVMAPSIVTVSFEDVGELLTLSNKQKESANNSLVSMYEGSGREPPKDTTFLEGGDGLNISIWVAPSVFYSQTLTDLLSGSSDRSSIFSKLGNSARITLKADNLLRYARFAEFGFVAPLPEVLFDPNDGILSGLSRFKLVFDALMQKQSLDAFDVQIAGFRDRVPEIVLQLSLDPKEAAELVRKVQFNEQRARNLRIVEAAWKAEREAVNKKLRESGLPPLSETPSDFAELWGDDISDTLNGPSYTGCLGGVDDCSIEAAALSEIYSKRAAVIKNLGENDSLSVSQTPGGFAELWGDDISEAFNGSSYTGCLGGADVCSSRDRFMFLQPPFTEDDFRYLDKEVREKLEQSRADLIENDRYRLISMYDDKRKILWIASDRSTLETEHSRGEVAEANSLVHLPRNTRADVTLNPERIFNQMSADQYGDSDISDLMELFQELSVYDSIKMSINTLERENGIRVDISLER